ncbi:hypothetical protein CEXT_733231 [Caerostris extrusa]|uniref:Uncharacterized protein n=1 Tax=Caerostris extrusa TaxID=172846 RepID=A0AAV4QYD6_CAEEX|nr:hypothetical protein CEXT_733231 [Caerostris extrusa]
MEDLFKRSLWSSGRLGPVFHPSGRAAILGGVGCSGARAYFRLRPTQEGQVVTKDLVLFDIHFQSFFVFVGGWKCLLSGGRFRLVNSSSGMSSPTSSKVVFEDFELALKGKKRNT